MQIIRKITTAITVFTILLVFTSCRQDPCFESQCFGDGCEDGVCECDSRNWSYITWKAGCISCSSSTSFVAVLEVDGAKVKEISISGGKWISISNLRIPGAGTKPYRIYTRPYYYHLESGNLNLIRCEAVELETSIR